MTQIGSVYAQGLYDLAKDEELTELILEQLQVLGQCFRNEPNFLRLLNAPNLSKDARCSVLDESFRGRVHIYVLNFLKLLTEKGYIRHFSDCCKAYCKLYNQDHGILEVSVVSAIMLTTEQKEKLTQRLHELTGKRIELLCRVDPACLGGVRLDYDGKRLDGTVKSRLETVGALLKNTVL